MTEESQKVRIKNLILRAMQEIVVRGGVTSEELADILQVDIKDLRPRLSDLKKANRIYLTAERRPNRKGRRLRVISARPGSL